jgi:hypothetical protein
VNNENVSTVSEAQQLQYHQRTIQQYFACDADVTTVNWFLLVDEPYRDGRDAKGNVLGGGWQSGLMTAGGEGVSTAKPAYAALAPLHNQGRAACTGKEVDWKPASAGGGSGGGSGNGGSGGTGGGSGGGSLDLEGVSTLFDEDIAANVAGAFAELQTAFFTGTSSWTDLRTTIDSVVASFQLALGQFRQRGHVDFTTAWLPNGVSPNQLLKQLGWSHGARALSRVHAPRATVLARASATVKAGQTLTLKPKRVSTAAVGAGTIYAAIRIRAAADPSNVGVVVQKVAVVKAAPRCKKEQKSTAAKPCRKK